MNPWLVGASIVLYGGSLAWRKWIDPPPRQGPPTRDLSVPRTDEGAQIPLIYGRCRVRAPILAWVGKPHMFEAQPYFDFGNIEVPVTGNLYACSMFMVLGIPFKEGTNRVHRIWAGELALEKYEAPLFVNHDLSELVGDGGFEGDVRWSLQWTDPPDTATLTMGYVEFFNGNASQQLVDPVTLGPTTRAGQYMTVNDGLNTDETKLQGTVLPERVPGYRGFMSVLLYNGHQGVKHWITGNAPNVPLYSFEASSYPTWPRMLTIYDRIGDDANPIDVIWDILLTSRAKLGIDAARLDGASFVAAAVRCYQEGHGFSRSFEEDRTAAEILTEILEQVGGLIYEDTSTGLIRIKLIRADFDPTKIKKITRRNCDSFLPTSTGWSDLPNKIRVKFLNRAKDYQEDSVTAQNLGSVLVSGAREVVITMLGVCTEELATSIAERELAELSRPLMTATAIGNRELADLNPGDPVMVEWTDPDVAGIVFRVTGANRGRLQSGKVELGLIQDTFYVWRKQAPKPPPFDLPKPPATTHG